MSAEIAIAVDQASKAYRLWDNPSSRLTAPLYEIAARLIPELFGLKTALRARSKRLSRDFWALQPVSFHVRKGESMAIIGRNGSGKSTLLQIIAGTLQPTTGSVRVNGRIAALLELGSGFNPDFTGRENIQLNAALFGLSKKEIAGRFDEIVAFAELEEFIEQPVKTYSSGMAVRLAFAIAAHIEPDILIVDEALSVGDARFQLKCARAIDRFVANGVTILFVSHDASMVKRLCRSAILLERGQMLYSGHPNDVVNLYSKLTAEGGSVQGLEADIAALATASPSIAREKTAVIKESGVTPATQPRRGSTPTTQTLPANEAESLRLQLKAMETVWESHPHQPELSRRAAELLENERLHIQVRGKEFAYGGDLGQIASLLILDANGQARTWFTTGENVCVRMLVEAREAFHEPIFALTVKNVAGVEIYGTNTLFGKQPAAAMPAGTRREIDFSFGLNLMPGYYFISAGFTHYVGEELVIVHRRYDAIKIEIHGNDRSFGIANLHAQIDFRELTDGNDD